MADLYKIIVADDEFIIRDGLESFNWEPCGFTVTGSVSNGKKVLELMAREPADVVITDIRMPVMDGLELAGILKGKYPGSKVVILTGYKDFDYAKTAIASGVSEYLLKPVDLSELEALFLKLKGVLDSERIEAAAVNTYRKQLSETLPVAIGDFLRSVVKGKINDSLEIEEKINLLELTLHQPYYACAVYHVNIPDGIKQDSLEAIAPVNLYEPLKKYLESEGKGYFYFDQNPFELVTVLNFALPPENTSSYDFLEKAAAGIRAVFTGNIGFPVSGIAVGIGNVYTDIFSLITSYNQAVQAMKSKFFDESAEIFPAWKNKSIFMKAMNEYPYAKENSLLDAIWDGDENRIVICLDDFWKEFDISGKQIDPSCIQNMILQFLNVLDRKLYLLGMSLERAADIEPPFLRFMKSLDTMSGLKLKLRDLVFKVSEKLRKMNDSIKTSSHSAVQQAEKYIREHYTEKITLNQIADMVYLNPSYFSIQFKRETGANFVEFLKKCRIEKAKELLKRIDLKVYQIGEAVGYQNPKYFTDMFRESTGLTPLEYRQKLAL